MCGIIDNTYVWTYVLSMAVSMMDGNDCIIICVLDGEKWGLKNKGGVSEHGP